MKTKVKVIVAFIVALLGLTIAGNSIHYWLLPKVRTMNPKHGSLKQEVDIISLDVQSKDMFSFVMPKVVADTLMADYVKEEIGFIREGDVLARYDIDMVENELFSAEEEYAQVKEFSAVFLSSFQEEKLRLQATIKDLSDKIKDNEYTSDYKQKEMKLELDTAQLKLQLMEEEGIYQGTTEDILDRKLDKIAAKVSTLKKLSDNKGEIRSPVTGILLGYEEQQWKMLPDGSSWDVVITIDIHPETMDVALNAAILANESTKKYPVNIKNINSSDNMTEVVVTIPQETETLLCLLKDCLKFEYVAITDGLLVPAYAFITESSLYTAEKSWNGNKRIDMVKMTEVKAVPGNDQYWIVTEGLTENSNIITYWDRTLSEGCEVVIE